MVLGGDGEVRREVGGGRAVGEAVAGHTEAAVLWVRLAVANSGLKSWNGIANGTRPESSSPSCPRASRRRRSGIASRRAAEGVQLAGRDSFSAVATAQRADGGLHAASVTAEWCG